MSPLDPSSAPAWAHETVHLAKPDPQWAELTDVFAVEIRALLAEWLTGSIVHAGSTAIPDLPAKPIIDLQATAADPAAAIEAEREAMAAASWFFVPRELDQRFWRRFVVRSDASGRRRLAHLHPLRSGEPRWHDQIIFRDRLRESPNLAREYAEIKVGAAREHADDREAYTQAKHAFVRRVLDDSSGRLHD